MSDADISAQLAAADAYEKLFVPALFQQWTPVMLLAAKIQPGDHVLDVACGTGVLTRAAAARVGPSGSATGLDITPGMIKVAKRLAPAIEWKLGPAESLPFPDRSYDAAISQFGFMFFPDRVKSLREMARVVKPLGRLAVAVWDRLESMPAYADEVELLERTAGANAANALRAPFTLGNPDDLLDIAKTAGIASARVTTHKGTAEFPSIRAVVEADLRGWLPMMGVPLEEALIQDILTEAEQTMGKYVNAQGRAVFAISAHVLTGTKP